MDLPYAIRSFVGYLEGTEKSAHTIKNYRSDLVSFQNYLEKGLGSNPVGLSDVSRDDLEKYHGFLKTQGLKTNTRRRKILTIRKLLRYLTKRNKLPIDMGNKLPAPHKIERIPLTVPYEALLESVRGLPSENLLQARNRALLWTLVETGCQVSEVTRLKFEDFSSRAVGLGGKSSRSIPISDDLSEAIRDLKTRAGDKSPYVFLGFNKFGSLGAAISPRGVELLVKSYAKRLGFEELTPRTFRHSAVMKWFQEGLSKETIQKRLGLKTDYAFRAYDALLASTASAHASPSNPA